MTNALPRLLCVDDEPNLLAALRRSLDQYFEVVTAVGAASALAQLASSDRFAVVLSDMRMPDMDGATFLAEARSRWPETVRVLLTGQADTQAAIHAINEGGIFRFLTKPCSQDVLVDTLRQAAFRHRTLCAESALLETTLTATVNTLAEVLALSAPWVFQRASFARACVSHALKKLAWPDAWMVEVAASLSQIGGVGIAEDTIRRDAAQRPLNGADARLMAEHPETAWRLLKAIPRFEIIADIVRYQAAAPPSDACVEVVRGAELLRAALLVGRDVLRGRPVARAAAALRDADPPISRACVEAIADFRVDPHEARAALIGELVPGWILGEDLSSLKGRLLLSKGHELTEVAILALRRLHSAHLIQEPIHIHCH